MSRGCSVFPSSVHFTLAHSSPTGTLPRTLTATASLGFRRSVPTRTKSAPLAHDALSMSNMDDGESGKQHGTAVLVAPLDRPNRTSLDCTCSIDRSIAHSDCSLTGLAPCLGHTMILLPRRFLRSLLGPVRRCGRHNRVARARGIRPVYFCKGEGGSTSTVDAVRCTSQPRALLAARPRHARSGVRIGYFSVVRSVTHPHLCHHVASRCAARVSL